MDVIIEGPDGSGKSTLVKHLHEHTKWEIVPGKGPEREPGEMKERVRGYIENSLYHQRYGGPPRIFDRHPIISHPIYSRFTAKPRLDLEDIAGFDDIKKLIVYCRAPDQLKLKNHNVKPGESEDHVAAVVKYHSDICTMYDAWALDKADLIYRYWTPNSLDGMVKKIISLFKDE